MADAARTFDLVVLGAGPAGSSAAIAARKHGLSVAVIDENAKAGGQVYRAPSFAQNSGSASSDQRNGERLRSELDASGASLFFGHKAWFVAPGGRISTVSSEGASNFSGQAVIVATGTSERAIPVPGMTIPGVIGLAAATIALKAHATVPPGPTLVAGVGPLLYAVAAGILKHGGTVAAVVDLARPGDWLSIAPRLASRPDLLWQGMRWMASLRRAGVPMRFGHAVTAIHGSDHVQEVEIRRARADWSADDSAPREIFRASSVAIGHGLTPATEVARLFDVPMEYRVERGGWVPHVNEDRSTVSKGIYIAGDCAGISGAAAAGLAGELAALSAARDLGRLPQDKYETLAAPVRTRHRRAEIFGWSISALMALRPGLVASIPRETIVCRCEDVSRATIEDTAKRGAVHVNQLKSTTRCGMGPCQGRMCGDAAAEIVAMAAGIPRDQAGSWTARTPLRTVPLASLLGDYSYDDIPKPPPLPG